MGATPETASRHPALHRPAEPLALPPGRVNRRPGAPVVGFILAVVVLSTLAMVSFIWYRWHGVIDPSTAIILEGDATLDGAVITVSNGPRKTEATLNKSNDFRTPILLPPGDYIVHVAHDQRVLINTPVHLKRFMGLRFNLLAPPGETKKSTSRPAAPPAPSP